MKLNRTRNGLATVQIIIMAVVLAAGGLAWVTLAPGEESADVTDRATKAVERKDMVVSVSQPGTLEAQNKVIIRSQVRRDAEIKWLIEEGEIVAVGDKIIEFDSTAMIDRQTQEEQEYDSAVAELVASRVQAENTESQATSNVAKARLDLEFAKMKLQKYLEGDYPQQEKAALADVEISKESYARAKYTSEQSWKLYEQNYITKSEADADAASANKARLDLEIAEEKLRVLRDYTYVMDKRQKESDVEQAEAELTRIENKARADVEKAKVDLARDEARVTREERHLKEAQSDVENCIVTSPVNGRVVFAPQGDRWNRGQPLSEGANVRFQQEIIHIPESGSMAVAIKIDESQRHKLAEGMPVRITGTNMPDAGYRATLYDIAEYLDPSGFWNGYQKVYNATIHVNSDQDVTELRTGMNCQTEIIVAYYEDVLQLPVQCVLMIDGQPTVYVPDGKAGSKPVPVEVGMDNGNMVHILSGIDVGTEVLLVPPMEDAIKSAQANGSDRSTYGTLEATRQTAPQADKKEEDADAPQVDEDTVRMLQMLPMMRDRGMFERLELDETTLAAVNKAIDEAGGGTPELDAATLKKLTDAMNKLRQGMGGGQGGPGGPGGSGGGPGGPG